MDVVIEWLLSMLANMLIATYYGIATTVWWLIKLVNNIATFITTDTLWVDLLDTLMGSISTAMPGVLDGLVFSPTGVMYLALSLSGILLIINRGGMKNRIADPAQVIVWGVLVGALFVGGTLGYDLIGFIEQMRLDSANLALTTIAPTGEIGDLVAVPMRATGAEALTPDFELPAQFETDFFPEADPADITTQDALLYDSFVLGPLTVPFDIEDAGAQQARKEEAVDGLFIALLTIGPAAVEGMFAVIYAAIAAATFVLIIFFLSVLPLGFFSFGKEIIENIIKQYFMLWMLTLASAVIIGILLGSGAIFLPANPTIGIIISGYLPILIVASIAVTYLMKLAFNVMMGTAGMVTATLRDEVGASAYNTQMPAAGNVPLSNTANAGIKKAQQISTLATAAVSGGMSIVALGGLAAATGGSVRGAVGGAMMSRMRPEAARDAAMLARYTSDGRISTSFAATAMGRNFVPAAVGLIATRPNAEKPEKTKKEDTKPVQSSILSDEDLTAKVSKSPVGQEEKRFKKVAAETGMQNDRQMRELIRIMRASNRQAKTDKTTRFKAANEMLISSKEAGINQLDGEQRAKLINSGTSLVDDHQAKAIAKDIAANKTGSLGNLAKAKTVSEADIARAIKLGFKAAAESDLTGQDNTAQRLAELLEGDKKLGKLPEQDRANISEDIHELTGIKDSRKLTEPGQLAGMVLNPATAPAGADHGAMAAIKEIAKANKLDLEQVIGQAQAGAERAKKGGNAPAEILKQFDDSNAFEHVDASSKADLARNADLVLQSIKLEPAAEVAETGPVGPTDVYIKGDESERDAHAAKVEVVNQPNVPEPPPNFIPELDQTEVAPINVDVKVEPQQQAISDEQSIEVNVAAPDATIIKEEGGTKDVRVVEDSTQRDALAQKVEIVADQTDKEIERPQPKEFSEPPMTPNTSPLLGEQIIELDSDQLEEG